MDFLFLMTIPSILCLDIISNLDLRTGFYLISFSMAMKDVFFIQDFRPPGFLLSFGISVNLPTYLASPKMLFLNSTSLAPF